jgi:hypothetical protein
VAHRQPLNKKRARTLIADPLILLPIIAPGVHPDDAKACWGLPQFRVLLQVRAFQTNIADQLLLSNLMPALYTCSTVSLNDSTSEY